jgi:hypothetical protein
MSKKEERDYYGRALAGESREWFQRFEIYRNMDRRYRTILAAYKQYCKLKKISVVNVGSDAPTSWTEASRLYQWEARARTHDIDRMGANQQEKNATKVEQAKVWARRSAKKKDNDWEDAMALREKAMELLNRPIQWITVRVKDLETGQYAIVTKPFGWTTKDALLMLKVASDLSQSAIGSEVELIQAINVMVENEILPADALMFLEKNMSEFHTAIRGFFAQNYSSDWAAKDIVAALKSAPNN